MTRNRSHGLSHAAVALAVSTFGIHVSPRAQQKILPMCDAILTGTGDAFARDVLRKSKINKKAGIPDLPSLAGSWVLLVELDGPQAKEKFQKWNNDKARELHASLAERGLVVIGVAQKKLSKSFASQIDFPVWVTKKAKRKSSTFVSELGLDMIQPAALLIDPCGMIAGGGRTLPYILAFSDALRWTDQWVRGYPGLPLSASPTGSPLRKAIAKRDWATARKLAKEDPTIDAAFLGILESQVTWAEWHLEHADVVSAEARLETLNLSKLEGELGTRVKAIVDRLANDQELQTWRELQRGLLDVFGRPIADMKKYWRMRRYAEPDYRVRDAALRRVESTDPKGTLLMMTSTLRKHLDAKSPRAK